MLNPLAREKKNERAAVSSTAIKLFRHPHQLSNTQTHTHKFSSIHVPTRANVSQPVAMALHSVALLCLLFFFQSPSTFPLPVSICCYCSRHCCRHYFCCCCYFHFYCPSATYTHTHVGRVDEAGRCLFALSTTNWIGSVHSEAKGNRQACFNVCSLPCVAVLVLLYVCVINWNTQKLKAIGAINIGFALQLDLSAILSTHERNLRSHIDINCNTS